MAKPALLIIDMQNDFVRDGAPLQVPGAGTITGNVRAVLEEFRKRNLPVVHVLRIHRNDGSDVETSRRELFRKTPFAVAGTKGAEVIDELAPREGEYRIHKTRMSAFLQTDLDLLLRSLFVDTVYIAGIQTPNCIRTTAFDSFALNYATFLVEDAVAARTQEIHRANCDDMAAIGIGMVKTADMGRFLDAR